MADARTLMAFGMDAEVAKLVVGVPARISGKEGATLAAEEQAITEEFQAFGEHAEFGRAIATDAAVERLMAVGMNAELAKAVRAVMDD